VKAQRVPEVGDGPGAPAPERPHCWRCMILGALLVLAPIVMTILWGRDL
jgi:hypothetical protein